MIVFTLIGVWELCKLGRVVERVTRKNKELKSTLPLTISAQEGLIDQNVFFNKSVASRDVSGYYLIYNGEFAYNKSYSNGYPWGAIKRLNRYDMGVLSTLYIIFKPKNIDSNFLEKYYDTSCWYHEVSKHAAEGARNHGLLNIAASDFLRTELTVPKSVEEQRKVGNFLKQLDDTITLHQRKLDQLKKLKKAYLHAMFVSMNTKKNKVPKLRFTDFEGDWELCKLGQVANYRRGSFPQPYGNKEWYDGENSMPFVQVVDVGDNLRLVEDTKQKISELAQPKSVFVKEGKVVVTLQGSIGRVAITQYPAYVDRTLLIFESYKAEMDEYYFAYVIQQLFEYEKTRAPGGTIKTVTKEALSDFTISFPSIEEQKKLGKFFEQLDDTITLHQNKLEQLNELKKSYLQNMFI
ncbi:restriction endonuclease subunit S [Enterococcus faecalis]|uniref:restriction endonuclease subunit S n=1 Tax=Enterococcus faecalis TaxID=1351 RepID=UPI0004A23656|nr:restriction endonuclease subunit S [Enterococcus faecalis]OOC95254.1 type I restriction endonuclease subunit S [Enterococcus faecalis ATCC 29212]NIH14944.1 restriction endonuclease subunit S [Enterococcus faecalis]NSQ80273.1 restriction endonuclease subunit S [Enterococcus faecalis]NST79025.1 restriction endonuclease subunit S [Enterococcus faecalis]NST83198.1 restriction endonuclease subunit S [Enterococcus faecalis]